MAGSDEFFFAAGAAKIAGFDFKEFGAGSDNVAGGEVAVDWRLMICGLGWMKIISG